MIKKMLINATHTEENRVAIVEDGILTELDIEIAGREQTKGNIYKAERGPGGAGPAGRLYRLRR